MLRIVVIVFGCLLLSGLGTAAEHRGTLSGRVTLGDGSPLAGVPLQARDEASGEVRSATTGSDGRFTIPELTPGSYRLTLDDDRYRTFAARAQVRSFETTLLELHPGQPASSAVDYRSYFQYVDRTSPWFRTRFDAPLILSLPLDGRNITDLVALPPGLTTTASGPVAGGTLSTSTAYLLDGVAAFDPLFGTPVLPLIPESIEELSILTPSLDTRLGRSAGAQVTVVTRSGTNDFRGSGFGFYQHQASRVHLGGLVGGPVRRSSTFFFGDVAHAREEDPADERVGWTQASGRIDHVTGPGRLTARYALGRGGLLDRRGDIFTATHVQQLSSTLTNDVRVGHTRLAFGERWSGVLPEFDSLEAANVLTWTSSAHVVTGGAEYFRFAPVQALGLAEEGTISAFVQDQWRASSALSLTGGIRYDRLSRDTDLQDDVSAADDSLVAPRVGVAWVLGPDARHVVRGDYGRHLQVTGSSLDAWSVGVQRQWGRSRTVEVGYHGTRVDDEFRGFGTDARYDALRIQLQQRSETALSTQVGYTYSRWTINSSTEAERVRASLDSPHKVTAAFAWQLPFGDEGRWFTGGLMAKIFEELQVSGIAVAQSGRPRINRNAPPGPPWRNLDLAVSKTLRVGGSALELRGEMFNVANRTNPRPPVLGTGFEELFADRDRERRYQFGGRWGF